MFYVSSRKDNLIGVTDSEDNVEEFYTEAYLKSLNICIIGFNSDLELHYTFTIDNLNFILTDINGIKGWSIKANYANDSTVFKCRSSYLGYPVISFAEAFIYYHYSDIDITGLDASNVITMECIFLNAKDLVSVNFGSSAPKVTMLCEMFHGCESLSYIKLPYMKPKYLNEMFNACKSLEEIDLSMIDATEVIDISRMFMRCLSLLKIDLSKFKCKSLNKMFSLFFKCEKLQTVDLSGLSTKGVESMVNIFSGCKSLKHLDLSNFNTTNVLCMDSMFFDCTELESIILSSFNTKQVNSMYAMFRNCTSLKYLDLSSFRPKEVDNISQMFCGCTSLSILDISNLDIQGTTLYSHLFTGCNNLWIVKSVSGSLLKYEIPYIALMPYKERLPYDFVIKYKRGTDLQSVVTKLLLTVEKKKLVIGFIEI